MVLLALATPLAVWPTIELQLFKSKAIRQKTKYENGYKIISEP